MAKHGNFSVLKILILTFHIAPSVLGHDGPSEMILFSDDAQHLPFRAVTATVPNLEQARKFARGLVEEKLAATVNIVPNIISTYIWDGEVRELTEFLLLINTHEKVYKKMEEYIRKNHVHVEPGIVAFPIVDGSKSFFEWFEEILDIEKTEISEEAKRHGASRTSNTTSTKF